MGTIWGREKTRRQAHSAVDGPGMGTMGGREQAIEMFPGVAGRLSMLIKGILRTKVASTSHAADTTVMAHRWVAQRLDLIAGLNLAPVGERGRWSAVVERCDQGNVGLKRT